LRATSATWRDGAPDPGSVATWLPIILDEPDITPQGLLTAGDCGFRALGLALAEARLLGGCQRFG